MSVVQRQAPAAPVASASPPAPPPPLPPAPRLDRERCTYTACYCEENVYHLLWELIQQHGVPPEQLFACFISNAAERAPLWRQVASNQPDGSVVWDYHVLVLQVMGPLSAWAWDLDALVPFPCSFEHYARQVLRPEAAQRLPSCFRRRFRLVAAASFLERFASDRSHMRLPGGSGWCSPPPPYPCIRAPCGAANTLPQYRAMAADVLQLLPLPPPPPPPGDTAARGGGGDVGGAAGAWQQVRAAAARGECGVVVDEPLLLRCLLGQPPAGAAAGRPPAPRGCGEEPPGDGWPLDDPE